MQFKIETPTKAFVENYTTEEVDWLRKELTYTNEAASYDVKRHYNNAWQRRKNPDGWQKKLEELKSLVKNTLVFEEGGRPYIRPSSIPYLGAFSSTSLVEYPNPKKLAWAHTLPFELHPYQEESVVRLLEVKHGNVELCTGAGKSVILMKLCRETGFRTAVVAPSKSIFNELVERFEYFLGRSNVGKFGDGTKKIGKRITICIADSLVNIKPGSEEWEFFSNLDMLCVDESHTFGAETLEAVCHGILANIPYRFFVSGTQTRGDGTQILLQSIIGQTVHRLTTAEAVRSGYICPHHFIIVDIESSNPNYNSPEPLEEKRIHFLNNRNIAAFAAKLANVEAVMHGRQTLILVEELNQINMIKGLLKVPYSIAHSEKNKERLIKIDLEKVDVSASVEKFNKNEVQVLIGTSCISTGTNIYPVHNCINWVGGASEIKTKQGAIGRSVRLHGQNPWKDKCIKKIEAKIWDFNVYNNQTMRRHLEERILLYAESESSVKRINFR